MLIFLGTGSFLVVRCPPPNTSLNPVTSYQLHFSTNRSVQCEWDTLLPGYPLWVGGTLMVNLFTLTTYVFAVICFPFILILSSCKDGLWSCIIAFWAIFRVRQSTDKWLLQFVWFHPSVCSEVAKLKLWGAHLKSPSVWSSLCRTVYVLMCLKLEGFFFHIDLRWRKAWGEHLFVRAGFCDITNCLDINNDPVSQLIYVLCRNLKPPPRVKNWLFWSRKQFASSSF